jgi:hypothetical protein
MKFIAFVVVALGFVSLAGCEMSKTTTPNSTTVKIDPKQ